MSDREPYRKFLMFSELKPINGEPPIIRSGCCFTVYRKDLVDERDLNVIDRTLSGSGPFFIDDKESRYRLFSDALKQSVSFSNGVEVFIFDKDHTLVCRVDLT